MKIFKYQIQIKIFSFVSDTPYVSFGILMAF